MRQCLALAALACLWAVGCANSGMLGCGDGCCPGHVMTSQHAPRPGGIRNGPMPCCGAKLFCKKEAACGCDDGCDGSGLCGCSDGSCGKCRTCRDRGGVLDGRCMCAVEGIASGFCPCHGSYPEQPTFNPGPPVGQVAYPYYTVRGPRDFLMKNPPSIGPY